MGREASNAAPGSSVTLGRGFHRLRSSPPHPRRCPRLRPPLPPFSRSQLQTFPSSPPLRGLPQSLPAARKTKVLTSEAEKRRWPLCFVGPEGLRTRKEPTPGQYAAALGPGASSAAPLGDRWSRDQSMGLWVVSTGTPAWGLSVWN